MATRYPCFTAIGAGTKNTARTPTTLKFTAHTANVTTSHGMSSACRTCAPKAPPKPPKTTSPLTPM
eukprot:21510-Pelagococcus_subviridis.AAC.1